ncbi:MAG: DUF262 domain-containing protein, partial [Deltaproteobacteria bacterium]|nr:DUF262 domain-containing protein [Deltaproteobacteria bacterium]
MMETLLTIKNLLNEYTIEVPNFQRAYSWISKIPERNKPITHTDIFLLDLEEHIQSGVNRPFYFGHFIFHEKIDDILNIVDGQQRLTTIVIMFCVLYSTRRKMPDSDEDHKKWFEEVIIRDNHLSFSTFNYDNQFFKDKVLGGKKNKIPETNSAKRIKESYDYFEHDFSERKPDFLNKLLQTILNGVITTHKVQSESEASQIFIFENSRGKPTTDLEVLKTQFMYSIHLHGEQNKSEVFMEINNRFDTIYRNMSYLDDIIDEERVLNHALTVYYNDLDKNYPSLKKQIY